MLYVTFGRCKDTCRETFFPLFLNHGALNFGFKMGILIFRPTILSWNLHVAVYNPALSSAYFVLKTVTQIVSSLPKTIMRSVTGYLLRKSSTHDVKTVPSSSSSAVPDAGNIILWKRRFFKLQGCSFTYYSNHQTTQSHNGQLFVFAETIVTPTQLSDQKHCFSISIPFEELVLACDSANDLQMWQSAFKQSIALAHGSLRGYLMVRMNEGKEKKKYAVLHGDYITIHKDAESLHAVQGLISLNDHTLMEYSDHSHRITLIDTPPPQQHQQQHQQQHTSFILRFDETISSLDYTIWKETLISSLRRHSKVGLVQNVEATINIAHGIPNQRKQGILRMRPFNNTDHSPWTEHMFFLNGQSMFVVNYQSPPDEKLHSSRSHDTVAVLQEEARIIREYPITPNCTVCETSWGLHTFQLITPYYELQVQASNPEDALSWIEAIRQVIVDRYRTSTEPLFLEAKQRLDDDDSDAFYTVTFPYKQSLGVTFEQVGEWAIVKSSNDTDGTGILTGSALSQINGISYVLKRYVDVMEYMQHWKPPLSLTFRHALHNRGYLWVKSTGHSAVQKITWKKYYFELSEGYLQYKRLSSPSSPETSVQGKIIRRYPLKDAMVSLVEENENPITTASSRHFYCFRFKGCGEGTDASMMGMTIRCVNR